MTRETLLATIRSMGNTNNFDDCSDAELEETIANMREHDAILARFAQREQADIDRETAKFEEIMGLRKPLPSSQPLATAPIPSKKFQHAPAALERAIKQAKNGTARASFRARVTVAGCSYYLGTYASKDEADSAVAAFKATINP